MAPMAPMRNTSPTGMPTFSPNSLLLDLLGEGEGEEEEEEEEGLDSEVELARRVISGPENELDSPLPRSDVRTRVRLVEDSPASQFSVILINTEPWEFVALRDCSKDVSGLLRPVSWWWYSCTVLVALVGKRLGSQVTADFSIYLAVKGANVPLVTFVFHVWVDFLPIEWFAEGILHMNCMGNMTPIGIVCTIERASHT